MIRISSITIIRIMPAVLIAITITNIIDHDHHHHDHHGTTIITTIMHPRYMM